MRVITQKVGQGPMGMQHHLIDEKLAVTLKTERGQWLLFMKDTDIVGRGYFKKVYYAISLQSGEKKALLVAPNDLEGEILNDLRMRLQLADAPYVMPIEDYFIGDEIFTISPFAPGGTLEERFATASPEEILGWIEEVHKSFIDLHRRDVMHRDGGFNNILIEKGKIRRIDFDMAHSFIDPQLGYAEFLSGEGIDVLTFGQALYEDARSRWGDKAIPASIQKAINTLIRERDRVPENAVFRRFSEISFQKPQIARLSGKELHYAVSRDGETLVVCIDFVLTREMEVHIQAIAAMRQVRNIVIQCSSAGHVAAIPSEHYIPLGKKGPLLPVEGKNSDEVYPLFQLLVNSDPVIKKRPKWIQPVRSGISWSNRLITAYAFAELVERRLRTSSDLPEEPLDDPNAIEEMNRLAKIIFGSEQEILLLEGRNSFAGWAELRVVTSPTSVFPLLKRCVVLDPEQIRLHGRSPKEREGIQQFIIAHELVHLEEKTELLQEALHMGTLIVGAVVADIASKQLLKFAKGPVGLVGGFLSYWVIYLKLLEQRPPISDSLQRRFEKSADLRGFAACTENGKTGAIQLFQELQDRAQQPFYDPKHPSYLERIRYLEQAWIEEILAKYGVSKIRR